MIPKLIFASLYLTVALWMAPVSAISQEETFDKITESLQKGDASKLAVVFDQTVDIGLPGNDNTYIIAQAEMVMKEFFKKHPPKGFSVEQQGSQGENTRYAIGYYLAGEKKFQVYTMIRKAEAGWVMHKLKFEEK